MEQLAVANPDGTISKVEGLDLHEVAELTGYSYDTVRRRISAGLWPYTVKGRRLYMTHAQVWAVVEASTHDYPAHEPGGK